MKRPTKIELEFTVLQCLNFLRDHKDQFFPHARAHAEKLLKLTAVTLRNPSVRDAHVITLRHENAEYARVERVIRSARKVFDK
jgi:hypothetical protein